MTIILTTIIKRFNASCIEERIGFHQNGEILAELIIPFQHLKCQQQRMRLQIEHSSCKN